MPIYEYDCPHCGRFEKQQRITEPALGRCAHCGRKVQRLISATSFTLKGTGWYATDYPHGSSGPRSEAKRPKSAA